MQNDNLRSAIQIKRSQTDDGSPWELILFALGFVLIFVLIAKAGVSTFNFSPSNLNPAEWTATATRGVQE